MRLSPCSTAPGSSSTRSSSNYHVTQCNNPSFTHSHHPPHDNDDQPAGECQNRVEDEEEEEEDFSGGHRDRIGGPMLPVFLNGLTRPTIPPSPTIPTSTRSSNSSHGVDSDSELVEVELVLREDGNIVLHSVTPTATSRTTPIIIPRSTSDRLGRSTSLTSRPAEKLRQLKSWWKRSASSRSFAAGAEEEDVEMQQHRPAEISSRERQMIARQLNRNRSTAQTALKGLRFISRSTTGGGGERKGLSSSGSEPGELWRQVELRFDRLAKNGLLDRNDFGECIGMMNDSKEFAVGIFDALARRKRRRIVKITKEEMYDFWLQLSDQSFDARLQIFFDIADRNEDGRITRDEVQELIVLSASANRLDALMDKAHEYANLIMEELDRDNLGYIELWQLEMLLLQRDANADYYSRPLSTASYGWSQNLTSAFTFRPHNIVRRVSCTLRCLLLENWQRGWIILLWFLAMAALFIWKFLQYRNRAAFQVMGYCLCTAKGAAETLKLNMALILLPVCRNTLTRLRATRARILIPFDDNINFHKMIAFAIVIGIVLHAGSHLACDFPLLVTSSPEKFSLIASDFEGGKKPTYGDLLTGIEGLTGIAMLILMAVSFTLATSRFRRNVISLSPPFNRLAGYNAFWYSHHLFALVYLLLLVHGIFLFLVHKWTQKTTWMYISVPVILYFMERSLRTCRSQHYTAKLLKVSELPGAVFTIIMSKPHGFKYRSGQYIFLQCPAISKFEWHPFSITSSPGDNYLSLHIRIAGDWTYELKKVLTADSSSKGSSTSIIGQLRFEDEAAIDQKGLPRLLIDGPYGAPAQDYQNYDVLLLVGLGIGATPFISILQDLLNNYRAAEDRTDSNGETSTSDESLNSFASMTTSRGTKKSIRTKSAHFYWVTREHASFEWFKGVMEEVAQMDHRGLIDMHNYLTCVYEEGDARSTLITMVNALNHAKYGVDILSGTRVKTHFARPNWKEVFTRIAKKHPYSTVGVFYCGRPVLAKELKKLTHEMSHKTTTRFEFHKEHF